MTGLSSLPLPQSDEEEQHGQSQFKGIARILGPRRAHLPTITVGLLGVQIFWSVEMSYASPYLLSLGLSKSSMAVVFVAGPISGLVMQPLIGVLADNCTSRFGRRRPYMLLGAFVCVLAMLLLGFTRGVASVFTGWDNDANDALTIWLAVLAIYLIDFSINAVQAVDRALLVDTLPSSHQASANAWAARMLGVGSVVGFFIGNVNLPQAFPFLGKTQLQVLSVVVSVLLLAGHVVMAVFVKERVLLNKRRGKSFRQEIMDMWNNIRTLPRVIRQIFIIQFFSGIGWFPVLFYSTLYIGDLYRRSAPLATSEEEQSFLDAEATRLGSRALFYSAILSLFINLTLPMFVSESARKPSPTASSSTGIESWWDRICQVPKRFQIHLATLWAVSYFVFAACMFATFFTHSVVGATLIVTLTGFSWAVAQWAPFSLLAEAILTGPAPYTNENATAIVLADTRLTTTTATATAEDHERERLVSGTESDEDEGVEEEERERERETGNELFNHSAAQMSRVRLMQTDEDGFEIVRRPEEESWSRREGNTRNRARGGHGSGSGGEAGSLSSKAGVILGIHNIFIVIPQFLVTGFAAILFAIFDPHKRALPGHHRPIAPHPGPASNVTLALSKANNDDNVTDAIVEGASRWIRRSVDSAEASQSNSVVYIFRIGGIAASFAFVLCLRLARELQRR